MNFNQFPRISDIREFREMKMKKIALITGILAISTPVFAAVQTPHEKPLMLPEVARSGVDYSKVLIVDTIDLIDASTLPGCVQLHFAKSLWILAVDPPTQGSNPSITTEYNTTISLLDSAFSAGKTVQVDNAKSPSPSGPCAHAPGAIGGFVVY